MMMEKLRYDEDALYKAAHDIYSLYFIGWLIGALTFLIGAIWAARKKHKATGITQSHFCFQTTIAIRAVVLFVVALALNIVWRYAFNEAWSGTVMVLTIIVYIWWWLARNIAGYRILAQQKAIANPHSWGRPQIEISE